MAKNEAQKLFGKKGGEIVSKIMAKVAKPKKKKYKVINSGYMDGKYLETKAPSNSKLKKHKSEFRSESKKYQIKRAKRFGAYYKSSNRND